MPDKKKSQTLLPKVYFHLRAHALISSSRIFENVTKSSNFILQNIIQLYRYSPVILHPTSTFFFSILPFTSPAYTHTNPHVYVHGDIYVTSLGVNIYMKYTDRQQDITYSPLDSFTSTLMPPPLSAPSSTIYGYTLINFSRFAYFSSSL